MVSYHRTQALIPLPHQRYDNHGRIKFHVSESLDGHDSQGESNIVDVAI